MQLPPHSVRGSLMLGNLVPDHLDLPPPFFSVSFSKLFLWPGLHISLCPLLSFHLIALPLETVIFIG